MRSGASSSLYWFSVSHFLLSLTFELFSAICCQIFSVYVNGGRRNRAKVTLGANNLRKDKCRSQWPRRLRHGLSWLVRTLRSWVRIPLKVWMFGVCMRLFCVCVVLSVGSGLATGWSPVQGVLPTVYGIKKPKKVAKVHQKDCRAIARSLIIYFDSIHLRTYLHDIHKFLNGDE
jgi:hypothetical protein